MFLKLAEGILIAFIVQLLNWAWRTIHEVAKILGSYRALFAILKGFARHGVVVRFSASAVLKLENSESDDQFLLCRSRIASTHNSWGPLGGVIKCNRKHVDAFFSSNSISFHRPGNSLPSLREDMLEDLRVVMKRRSLRPFLKWFISDTDRESAASTLIRELQEELGEMAVGGQEFDKVREDFVNKLNAALPRLSWDCERLPVVSIYTERPTGPQTPNLILHIKVFYVVNSNNKDELNRLVNEAMEQGIGQELRWFWKSEILAADGKSTGVHSQALFGQIDASKHLPIYAPENLLIDTRTK